MYLGVKYASIWAGIGAMAPATQPAGINPNNYSLVPAKDIPLVIVQGDMDTLVPHITSTRPWIEKMKELNITNLYVEVPGEITEACSPPEWPTFSDSLPNIRKLQCAKVRSSVETAVVPPFPRNSSLPFPRHPPN